MTEGGDLRDEACQALKRAWPRLSDDERTALFQLFLRWHNGAGPSTDAEAWAWFWAKVAELRQARGAHVL